MNKPWNLRSIKSGNFKLTKKRVLNNLSNLAGGYTNIINMLNSVLNRQQKRELMEQKYINVLQNLAEIYIETKPKDKHTFIKSFKRAGFTLEECNNLNFECGRFLWKSCDNGIERNKGGHPALEKTLKHAISDYMFEKSHEASNRTILINDLTIGLKHPFPVRYCNVSFFEAYNSFQYKEHLSLKTFLKYVPKIYKKPHRNTDVCPYCKDAKKLKNQLCNFSSVYGYIQDDSKPYNISLQSNNNFEIKNDINCRQMLEFYSEKLKIQGIEQNEKNNYLNIITKIKDYSEYQFHRCASKAQKKCFYNQITDINLLTDHVIIAMDFKQKIVIGTGPDSTGEQYYNQQQRTFLGFAIYYKDLLNEIDCIYFDVVSNNNQDGLTVINSLTYLFEQNWFKEIDKKNYIFWADTGKHFRNCEMIDFIQDLSTKGKKISLNFFVEGHGKNPLDAHFSNMGEIIDRESTGVKALICSKDIVDTINEKQSTINKYRLEKGLKEIKTKAVEFNLIYNNILRIEKVLKIKNLESFYNIEAETGFIKSKVFSFYDEFIIPEILIHSTRIVIEKSGKKEENVDLCEPNFDHLRKKRTNINGILKKEFSSEIFTEYEKKHKTINTDQISKCNIACYSCNKKINLDNNLTSFSRDDIDDELIRHGHNSTKKSLHKKKLELLLHYKNGHSKERIFECDNKCTNCSISINLNKSLSSIKKKEIEDELFLHGHKIYKKSLENIKMELLMHYEIGHKNNS